MYAQFVRVGLQCVFGDTIGTHVVAGCIVWNCKVAGLWCNSDIRAGTGKFTCCEVVNLINNIGT